MLYGTAYSRLIRKDQKAENTVAYRPIYMKDLGFRMSVGVDLQAWYAKSINFNDQSNTQLVGENQCFTVAVSSLTKYPAKMCRRMYAQP